jgi:hypothetical protein
MGDALQLIAWAWLCLVIWFGVTAGHRYGRLASFFVMQELTQLAIVIFGVLRGIVNGFDAYTRPLDALMMLIPGAGFLPPNIMGKYGGLSAGGLIFPLIFILVALFSKKRQTAQEG